MAYVPMDYQSRYITRAIMLSIRTATAVRP